MNFATRIIPAEPKGAPEEDAAAAKPRGGRRTIELPANRVWRVLSGCLIVGILISLGWISFRLAAIRIFQVDECQNVYEARLLASGMANRAYLNLSLLQFPIAWVSGGVSNAIDLFLRARCLMWEIFWLNLVLIAVATGESLRSLRGWVALLGAATLAPLWDYGFEVRHDNLLLTGILLIWCVLRAHPGGVQSYLIVGGVTAALQFVAFKSFVYTVPLSAIGLAFPPPNYQAPRWKLIGAWLLGVTGVLILFRIAYGWAGLWPLFLSDFRRVVGDATGGTRFAPGQTLGRLLTQTPLVLALVLSGVIAMVQLACRRGRSLFSWNGPTPEAMLLALATVALLANPDPYPYNLLHLVPYAYLFAFRTGSGLMQEIQQRPVLLPAVAAVVVFAHFVPFTIATSRHRAFTNFHQDGVMRLAEELTDPKQDPVYDGVGLVPTRSSIGFYWFLHSLNVRNFTSGSGPRVRDLLAANPAAVFLPNYRTDWLTDEDQEFIRRTYVPLADDFWVLGTTLPAGGGAFEIMHPGRYRISSLKASDIMGTFPAGWAGLRSPEDTNRLSATLDGTALSHEVVLLSTGTHRLDTAGDTESAVVWVGPRLDRIHRVSQNDHLRLFINWY